MPSQQKQTYQPRTLTTPTKSDVTEMDSILLDDSQLTKFNPMENLMQKAEKAPESESKPKYCRKCGTRLQLREQELVFEAKVHISLVCPRGEGIFALFKTGHDRLYLTTHTLDKYDAHTGEKRW